MTRIPWVFTETVFSREGLTQTIRHGLPWDLEAKPHVCVCPLLKNSSWRKPWNTCDVQTKLQSQQQQMWNLSICLIRASYFYWSNNQLVNRFICYLLTEESAHNVFVERVRNKFIKKKKKICAFSGGLASLWEGKSWGLHCVQNTSKEAHWVFSVKRLSCFFQGNRSLTFANLCLFKLSWGKDCKNEKAIK